MAQKSRRKPTSRKLGRAPTAAQRVARNRVITFRLSEEEVALIQKAADRVPLARYSRDGVLARAAADAKK